MTGAENRRFTYTIPMREDIAAGPYERLFTVGLTQLYRDMLNRAPGPLIDPTWGEVTCVPASWSNSLDPNRRDGTDVDVEFVEWKDIASETDTAGGVDTLQGLESDAGALDAEVAAVAREAQVPSPEPATDPLSAIAGVGAQLTRSRDRVTASLAQTSNRLEKIEAALDDLQDPLNGELIRETRRLRVSTARLAEKAEPTRVVRNTTANTNKALAAIAAELAMSIADLLKLNPDLAKSPVVLAGTPILFYDDA
jgi:hypothetical protein